MERFVNFAEMLGSEIPSFEVRGSLSKHSWGAIGDCTIASKIKGKGFYEEWEFLISTQEYTPSFLGKAFYNLQKKGVNMHQFLINLPGAKVLHNGSYSIRVGNDIYASLKPETAPLEDYIAFVTAASASTQYPPQLKIKR